MSNLTKTSNNTILPAYVSKKSKQVYEANNKIKISEMTDINDVVKGIHVLINTTILDVGHSVNQDDINYLKAKVVEDIMSDFRLLSLSDIKLAFQFGSRGEYGQYFGLNRVTFYNWLKSYKESTLSEVYKEILPLIQTKKEIEISQEEIDIGLAKNLCSVYFNLCTKGEYDFNDFGNVHYNFLERMNLINLYQKDIEEVRNEATQLVKSNIVKENSELNKRGKIYHKIDLSKAIEDIENKSNEVLNNRVQIEIKKLSLFRCLYNYASDEIDLFELLKKTLKSRYNETGTN